MKKYIQPEINVMEMELDSQLCQASSTSNSSLGISGTLSGGPAQAPTRPRFSIWESEDDVEE